jgi:hypothetical protein
MIHISTLPHKNNNGSIESKYTIAENNVLHDDCSNISDWSLGNDWDGWMPWFFSNGTLKSSNGYFHCTYVTPLPLSEEGYGPFWYKELQTTTYLQSLQDFRIEYEQNSESGFQKGAFSIILFDSSKTPVFHMVVEDNDYGGFTSVITTYFRTSKGNTIQKSIESETNRMETVDFVHTQTHQIVVNFPLNISKVLVSQNRLLNQPPRDIKYIGYQINRWRGELLDSRIYDILLHGGTSSIIQIPSDTTSSTMRQVFLLQPGVIVISAFIVLAAISFAVLGVKIKQGRTYTIPLKSRQYAGEGLIPEGKGIEEGRVTDIWMEAGERRYIRIVSQLGAKTVLILPERRGIKIGDKIVVQYENGVILDIGQTDTGPALFPSIPTNHDWIRKNRSLFKTLAGLFAFFTYIAAMNWNILFMWIWFVIMLLFGCLGFLGKSLQGEIDNQQIK